MRKTAILLSCVAIVGCDAALAKDLKVTVTDSHESWWLAPQTPVFDIVIADTLGNDNLLSELSFRITDDKGRKDLLTYDLNPHITGGRTSEFELETSIRTPGFYRMTVTDDGNEIYSRVFGYEPENIVSLPDSRPDFDEFWTKAVAEVKALPMDAVVSDEPVKAGVERDAYLVTYSSVGGETLKGYLIKPRGEGKYPVKITYCGYGAVPGSIDTDSDPDMVEFIASTRGQFLCGDDNRYGDWIRYHLDDPATYYYRGAYQDVVRAVDYVMTLGCADQTRIYAEGGSQGGAFTYIAAALDSRIAAIAPYIPFMSDFVDYLDLAPWPSSAILDEASRNGIGRDKVLENLSYFDVKNFARRIKCPVLMGVGLQDPVCPPHTNFSTYNLIDGGVEKHFVIYPDQKHGVARPDWNNRVRKFFMGRGN